MTTLSGFTSTADVPRGPTLSYRCGKCGGEVPSVPRGNVGCQCGNVFIDKDYHRLVVEDLGAMTVIETA